MSDSSNMMSSDTLLCPLLMESVTQFGSLEIFVHMKQDKQALALYLTFDSANLSVRQASVDNVSIIPSLVSFLFSLNITQSASTTATYELLYPMTVSLSLRRTTFESCLSSNNSLVLLNCTDTGPVIAVPIVSAAAAAVVQTSIAGSVAVAAVGGSASAGDVQSMVIIAVSRCARGRGASRTSPGDFKLVSPVALRDTPAGVLTGNAIAFFGVVVLQLVVVVALRSCAEEKVPLYETFADARFPALSLIVGASLHPSTLFSALHILVDASDKPIPQRGQTETHGTSNFLTCIGVLAMLAAVGFPLGLVLAAKYFPRQFMRFEFESSVGMEEDVPTIEPPWYHHIVPFGTIQPPRTKRMLSSLITAFRHPSPACVIVPFISSFAVNFASFASESTCKLAMIISGLVHVAVALGAIYFNIYNSAIGGALSALALLLLATFQFLIAAEMHNVAFTLLMSQALLSIVRCIVAIIISRCDDLVRQHPTTAMTAVMWTVGRVDNDLQQWFSDKSLMADLVPRLLNRKRNAFIDDDADDFNDAVALSGGGSGASVLMVPCLTPREQEGTVPQEKRLVSRKNSRHVLPLLQAESDVIDPLGLLFKDNAPSRRNSMLVDPFGDLDDDLDDDGPFAGLKASLPPVRPINDDTDDDDDPFEIAGLKRTAPNASPPRGASSVATAAAHSKRGNFARSSESVRPHPPLFFDPSEDNSDLDEQTVREDQLERQRNELNSYLQQDRLRNELNSFFGRTEKR